MSRCMAFPPPGCEWEGLSGLALKQLIEVRREKAEAEKKEKKRKKKKEKRRKRKEVEELEEGEIGWKIQSHHGSHKPHESSAVGEHNDCQIKREHEPQGLERSCLTEEFELPAIDYGLSMHEANADMETLGWSPESCLGLGSIASFEMVPTVCDGQEALFDKPVCLTTRMEIVAQEEFELANDHDKYQLSSCNSECARANRELCHSSASSEASKNDKTKLDLESRYHGSELEYIGSKYRELFVNWVPPSMKCMQLDSEDLEWLFEKKAKRVFEANIIELSKIRSHNLSRSSSVFHPTARYWPRVGTFALPLAIPF